MAKKEKALQKRRETVLLDAAGIDRLSALLTETLEQAGTERRDTVRLRLAMEDILALWQSRLGSESVCTFRCGTRLGRRYIQLLIPGERLDPAEVEDGEARGLLYSSLLAQAGLSPVYSYQDGINRLTLYPPSPQRLSPVLQLLLAIVAAGICGLLCLAAPSAVRSVASEVAAPLFTALMGILQTLAGPVIFLSVCWSVVSIGDVQVLGKIGRTVLIRFLAAICLLTGITAVCLTWAFRTESGVAAEGTNAAAQIYSMILGIIPSNIVSPFMEGNSLQIIFMAICVGVVLLVLGDKVSSVRTFVEQVNITVQFMMGAVSRYIPVLVFVSLFSLILSDALNGLGGVLKGLLLDIGACLLWPLLYALAASLRLRVSYPMLLRKLMPTYLIALFTASSAAALSTNLETCRQRLGISGRIVNFAVPLGQVMFKTGGAVGFFVLTLGLAEFYGMAMPVSWVVTAVITSGLVAIATPPVPGGFTVSCTVLLAQLGIPMEAVALVIAANVILDFFMTSCGLSCLQSELLLAANKLGMLDRELLTSE